MTVILPKDVMSPYDDYFSNITEYLKNEGRLGEKELIVEMKLVVKTGQLVEAEIVETEHLQEKHGFAPS